MRTFNDSNISKKRIKSSRMNREYSRTACNECFEWEEEACLGLLFINSTVRCQSVPMASPEIAAHSLVRSFSPITHTVLGLFQVTVTLKSS